MTSQNLNFRSQQESNINLLDSTETTMKGKRVQSITTDPGKKHNGSGKLGEISFKELGKGLFFDRYFCPKNKSAFDSITYTSRSSVIREPDGRIVFEMKDIEVPEKFSQLATDIVVSKYFRKAGVPETGRETSIRQLVHRIVHTIQQEGQQRGYFCNDESAQNFGDDLAHLLLNQKGAFNSPVWFNAGLYHEYQIEGSGGNWLADPLTEQLSETKNAYANPQLSACFIQSVDDDLMGIFELAKNEAKLFKYGSGTGSNFSNIRSKHEKLSGGGTSSGLMSFLEVLDRGAGATKSGGTTRRAAKMCTLNMDHPEILDFIQWKAREEKKAEALMQAGYQPGFEGEAYQTISGQNSNNSVRVSDEFMYAVRENKPWQTTYRTTGEVHQEHNARDLFNEICKAAYKCADPGIQYDSTINRWHTCPESGRIHGSNPCSEFMFLDDSACNLASLNLMKFVDAKGDFLIDDFKKAVRIFIVAQEIVVAFASYPTPKIAKNSVRFRPLGLGYANLGSLLMNLGIPYDSDQARIMAATISALMSAEAYKASAEIASQLEPFAGYEQNKEAMIAVMEKHYQACQHIDQEKAPVDLLNAALDSWITAIELGRRYGYRNAQTTLLAPTGTIGLLMDCDTTGIEPDFSLVKFKKLAGGGHFKIINGSLPGALHKLAYKQEQINEIIDYVLGCGSIRKSIFFSKEKNAKGHAIAELFSQKEIDDAEAAIKQNLSFDQYTTSINPRSLEEKGFSKDEINDIKLSINGSQTVEGAPHLKVEDYAVFDCANKCGTGKRYIAPMGHIKMMAAVQPFLSGAISKTVNLPNHATVEDIYHIYMEAWKLELKAVAIYRDGSKLAQPLGNGQDGDKKEQAISISEIKEDLSFVRRGVRKSLPIKRSGFTLESSVAGHKLFLRTGEYEDGKLGEIFIDMYKEGASYRSILNCFAIAVSIGLQYGVPLDKFVNAFTFTRFEPKGMTDHNLVKNASSILDFVFRVLGYEYLNRTDFLHVRPNSVDGDDEMEQQNPTSQPKSSTVKDIEDPLAKKKEMAAIGASGKVVAKSPDALDQQMADLMGDAPECPICGHLTVRNGTCYRCLNCGNSLGCS